MNKKELYLKMVREASARMNLVAKSTLPDLENRHWADSAQLAAYIGADSLVMDLGSGAGFPAVILAILGYKVVAIESIGKKAAFLSEVKSRLELDNLTVWNDRIENKMKEIQGKNNIVFVARAFASLDKILDLTGRVPGARWVLLKGRTAEDEIKAAKKRFSFDYKTTKSSSGDGFVLEINTVKTK
ncbi:MAG: 16S rRNA (guanine(527)-N(7))-methyltransferase RsmG [Rickettsiales bacterium]|jgi:16S rRNA (guanine527-N7)-methyltransferase|nr:16S rRNA (guanine(527)-N(7))-methyltransferase RsmG [Rickettsiales bacterium]